MMDVFIGVDVGTQGTKAIAYRPAATATSSAPKIEGRILARASASYSLLSTDVAGRAEQDPSDWIGAVRFVLKELVTDLGLLAAAPPSSSSTPSDGRQRHCVLRGIGISGQQHGMVLLDSGGQPLRPAKLWCDVEAAEESQWIRNRAAGKWDHVLPGFTSPKVLWTIRNEPHIWNRVRWCVLPHDYVNLVLRGAHDGDAHSPGELERLPMVPATDRGDASGSGLFDPSRSQYCMELANAIDPSGRYANALPKILEPLDTSGSLSLQWMKDIGLLAETDPSDTTTRIPYIPISVGSGDNMCSALGVGCVQPGMAVLSLGTSGTVFGVSCSPPSSQVAPFADACGRYLPLVCVMSCTVVLNSVLEGFFNRVDSNEDGSSSSSKDAGNHMEKWSHDEASERAMRHPPGCHGVTFLPYLTPGERTPNWPHASGAILGLTAANMSLAAADQTTATTPYSKGPSPVNPMAGLLYRAAMEGITYLLAEGVATMTQACGDGFQPHCLFVVGGGSRNRLWRQMLADVLGVELRFPKESDSAALGAAFQVGAAVAATRHDGGRKLTLEEYVLQQTINMEEEVVQPTSKENILQLYKDGRERYCSYSAKLFETGER